MEKRDPSRARSTLITFVVLAAVICVILFTVCIATLYRFTVKQSARIQTLEAIADDLAARVYKLETRFTAQRTEENAAGGTDRERQETTEKRLRNKVTNARNVISGLSCPKFCIIWLSATSINSYTGRFSFLQQMHWYPPQTRDKRQFQGFNLQPEGGFGLLLSSTSFFRQQIHFIVFVSSFKTAHVMGICRGFWN